MLLINQGLVIAVLGAVIVCLALTVFVLVLMVKKAFFDNGLAAGTQPLNAAAHPAGTNARPPANEGELVAVIAAAIAALGQGAYTSTYNLKVRPMKRQASNAPIWNVVSRKENLESRL